MRPFSSLSRAAWKPRTAFRVTQIRSCGIVASTSKAPIRLGLTAIASAQPSLDLPFQSLPVFDASVEALGDQNRQLGFGHVQPASMFGRVVPFETLNQAACLSGRKRFIE